MAGGMEFRRWQRLARLLSVLGLGLAVTGCFPALETYMRPEAPGGDLRAVNCTGAGTQLIFTLPHGTGLALRTTLDSKSLNLSVSAYKKWQSRRDSEARTQEIIKTIEITAEDDIVVEWENNRLPVRFGGSPSSEQRSYLLRRDYQDSQSIEIKNFTGDWALLTLPPFRVNGTEVTIPQIRLERRTIPALVSINC